MSVSYRDTHHTSRRVTGFLLFLLGVGLTVALFYVQTRAQTASREVRTLERRIAVEQAAIGVLSAEIAYLQSPARLSTVAPTLGLAPTAPENVVSASALLDIPLREEAARE